jgi:hypothetical protein
MEVFIQNVSYCYMILTKIEIGQQIFVDSPASGFMKISSVIPKLLKNEMAMPAGTFLQHFIVVHPSSYSMCTGGSFPSGKAAGA